MPSAAILNGGRATRFGGCDKGALLVGGRSIRDRQLQELWSSLEPHAKGEAGAPEPRVFGGFAFQSGRSARAPWDGFGEGQLVLPRLSYTRRDDRAWLTLAAAPGELASEAQRMI